MKLSFKDFVVACRKCNEVAWLSEKKCPKCSEEGHLISLDQAIKETGKVSCIISVAGGIIALAGLLTIPFFGIMPGLVIYGLSSRATKKARLAKEAILMEKSKQMFTNLETTQVYYNLDKEINKTSDTISIINESNNIHTVNYLKSAQDKGYSAKEISYNLANDLYKMNDFQKAISVLENLNQKAPDFKDAQELLAKSYLASGELDEERLAFIYKVKANANKDLQNLITLSIADIICKNYDKILDENIDKACIIREAIALQPENNQYIKTAAKIMMELGLLKSVVDYCSKLELNVLDKETAIIYAEALIGTDNLNKKAIKVFKKALELDPNNELILVSLCEALMRNGYYQETIDYCKKALSLENYNLNLRQILALAYMKIGHLEEAIVQLQTIRKKDDFNSLYS